jgi:urease accessory protein
MTGPGDRADVSASPWLVWQFVDSAFPIGGFAHSYGLEAAWHHGEVAGPDGLRAFVRATLLQTAHAVVPLVNAIYRTPERFEELDELADAFLTSAVANRASRVQGRALAATCARIWPAAMTGVADRSRDSHAHFAPTFGLALSTLGVSPREARQIALFMTLRGVLAAAVRLGIAGAYETQRIQSDCMNEMDALVHESARYDESDLAQPAPLLDVLQATHDRLYSRLFQS